VVDNETELPSVLRSNVDEWSSQITLFPVAAMKYRCVACCIVDISLIQDHCGIRKLQQRPRLASEPANCMDWYDRLT